MDARTTAGPRGKSCALTTNQEMLLDGARLCIREGISSYWGAKPRQAEPERSRYPGGRAFPVVHARNYAYRGRYYVARSKLTDASRMLFQVLREDYPPSMPEAMRKDISDLAKQTFRIAEKMMPKPRSTDSIAPRAEYL